MTNHFLQVSFSFDTFTSKHLCMLDAAVFTESHLIDLSNPLLLVVIVTKTLKLPRLPQ